MRSLLRRTSLRHLARHPWQIGLSILGIALGVAVAVSIDIANGSARRAFELSTEAVTGRATHQIAGGPGGLPDSAYVALRRLGVRDAAPVVAGDVAAPDHPGRSFHLLGIDPFAEAPFRPYLTGEADDSAPARHPLALLAELVAEPGTGLVAAPTARALGLRPGDSLAIRVAGTRRAVRIAGLLRPTDRLSARAMESLLVTDIATAQELLDAPGRLTRIDLVVPDDAGGRALLAQVAAALPPGAEISTAGARADSALQMARAFSLNLTALSLLALLVGMFLIYNTMTFSVIQRRPLIGILRALGVTRGEVWALVMAEAFLVGLIGTAAGLLLGVALATGMLRLVTRTINDLYFVVSVREVAVTWAALGKGAALGLGATLVAALAPAREATLARPRAVLSRSHLEAQARRASPRLAAAGLALGLAGLGALALPGGNIGLGFAGLFAFVLGCALLTPLAVVLLVRALAPAAGAAFGVLGRMAVRGIAASLSRTAVAVAALMIAVATTIGVGLMIGSFRQAVVRWLEGTLRADVYISPPSLVGNRPDATLDPALVARLIDVPGVAGASTSRAVVVAGADGPVNVVALGLGPGRRPGLRFLPGVDPERAWAAFDAGAVLVSEPFSYRRRVDPGGIVRLRTDRGHQDFPVIGAFYDYGSSAGAVFMSRATYERHWDDRAIAGLAVDAAAGEDVDVLMARLRAAAGRAGQETVIRSNRALRDASLVIFDRTFAITSVLRLLTMAVAFIGVLSALLALQLERRREVGVLRAVGLTPGQVWGTVTAQTGLMGAIAGLLAVPVGVLLSVVLIFVVNRRSFGWTMPLDLDVAVVGQGVGLAVAAGLLAGLYPAWVMSRASPAEALRDE
ncbi:MAG TPA: FtsX-like permease family protein [Candidatus Binatia bacterium]|nr:FtsX-like permease family protein [Candidatus Binatia bacterium]